jgi:hypothetical protein
MVRWKPTSLVVKAQYSLWRVCAPAIAKGARPVTTEAAPLCRGDECSWLRSLLSRKKETLGRCLAPSARLQLFVRGVAMDLRSVADLAHTPRPAGLAPPNHRTKQRLTTRKDSLRYG